MNIYLTFVQIIVAVLIVVSILLQQRGTALGGAFGGGDSGSSFATRRGIQQKLYLFTIVLGIVFISLALLGLLL